jgi:hypothetical protein
MQVYSLVITITKYMRQANFIIKEAHLVDSLDGSMPKEHMAHGDGPWQMAEHTWRVDHISN